MDSFEHIIAMIMAEQAFWTRNALKLTKEEKSEIGRASSPRRSLLTSRGTLTKRD